MKLTVEISMYPFRDGYIDPIQWFIERLSQYPNVERVTNAMATQISGDYNEVMALLAREMKAAYEKWGKSVFVCKFIGGALDLSHKQ